MQRATCSVPYPYPVQYDVQYTIIRIQIQPDTATKCGIDLMFASACDNDIDNAFEGPGQGEAKGSKGRAGTSLARCIASRCGFHGLSKDVAPLASEKPGPKQPRKRGTRTRTATPVLRPVSNRR